MHHRHLTRPPHVVARSAAAMLSALLLCIGPSRAIATGVLEPFGLTGQAVTSLGMYGSLYAGTMTAGVQRRDLTDDQAGWVSRGLDARPVRAIYPHAAGPLGISVTAGMENDVIHPDSVVVYCSCMDQPWAVADSGMIRADITAVMSLDGFPSPAICGETFAGTLGSKGGVWRRPFEGPPWEFVLDIGFGVCNVVHANARNGDVWAGGENAVMSPWIARSRDRGETWQIVHPDLAGDNACNSIAIHPDNPEVAYAGMEGPLIRTNDGGVTWEPTGLAVTQAYLYGVALDSGAPSHLLAGGLVRNPNDWALWESFDGGETWVERPAPLPGTTGITSILADPDRPGTFYIATLGHGVWRYRRGAVEVDDRALHPTFGRVYPNPFRAHTTIEFSVPSTLNGAPISLAVYDVHGRLVRELLNGAAGAATHRVEWNGRDESGERVAPGVYYGRLSVAKHQLIRRIALVR